MKEALTVSTVGTMISAYCMLGSTTNAFISSIQPTQRIGWTEWEKVKKEKKKKEEEEEEEEDKKDEVEEEDKIQTGY